MPPPPCFAWSPSPASFHYAGADKQTMTHLLHQGTGKKLARCAYRGPGVRRRHRQDLPPRLPLEVARYVPRPALEAELRIAAAAPRFAARPQWTQPPELEHVAIVTPQRRLFGAEPRRIVLGSLLLRRVFVHAVHRSGVQPTSAPFILPREAGKGDRPKGGGRGVGKDDARRASGDSARPLHHASHGPPPPLRFTTRGRISERILATRMRARVLRKCRVG
jgi:hypothetical protein